MRTLFGKFVAFAIVFAFANGSAQAALFSLNFVGQTTNGSYSTVGSTISNGTAFSVHAIFSDTTGVQIAPGSVVYQPSAISLTVGGTTPFNGTSYSVTTDSIGGYQVRLDSPTFPYNFTYGAALFNPSFLSSFNPFTGGSFYPLYVSATPGLDASHPSATVFSQYFSDKGSSLTFTTAGGNLTLAYNGGVGLTTTISAAPVPEPEEWAMMLVGSGLISWQLRRRAKASA